MIQATDRDRAERVGDDAAQKPNDDTQAAPPRISDVNSLSSGGKRLGEVGHISWGNGTPWAAVHFRTWRLGCLTSEHTKRDT